MPQVLSVGQPYVPGRTRWNECAQYNYARGEHRLTLFYRSPARDEVLAIRRGACEFALVVRAPLIVICFRFAGAGGWSDAPYTWHLVPEDGRDLPSSDLEADKRAFLQIVLVDADTGIVRALRVVTLAPAFTRALHEAIRQQATTPWNEAEYERALRELYQLYPSTASLVALAVSRTKGGA